MTPNTKKQFAKMNRAVKSLNECIAEVKKEFPDANYFLEDCGNLHLLSRDSHDHANHDKADAGAVIHTTHLSDSAGGGW